MHIVAGVTREGLGQRLLFSQPQKRGRAAGEYPGFWWEHACAKTQAAGEVNAPTRGDKMAAARAVSF